MKKKTKQTFNRISIDLSLNVSNSRINKVPGSSPVIAETRPSIPGISVFSDIASQLENREF